MFQAFGLSRRFLQTVMIFCLICFSNILVATEFLVISDIHFNPLAGLDKDRFSQLSQLPSEAWPEFLQSLQQPVSQPGNDSNFSLMVAALDAAKKESPDASFILFPGDFMAHEWQANYNRLAPQTIASNPGAFRDFTKKALSMLASEFKERFPEIPVHATLGNDDSFCQDYWIQPGGDYLAAFADVWEPLLVNKKDRQAFRESFDSLGAYTADLPGSGSDRLVVLNSVLWSASYCCSYFSPKDQDCCGCLDQGAIPGRLQFEWLEAQLTQARKENKRVWLLMHVPPGLDGFAEEKAKGESQVAELWTDEFTDRYLKIVDDYRDTLHISFTGHTHMDDFRVDRVNGIPVLLHKIAPAVSPIFGNNPAFQVFQIDDQNGVIENWQTYFMNIGGSQSGNSPAVWQQEYDARDTYRFGRFTATSITNLFTKMKAEPGDSPATAYRHYYAVNAKPIAEHDLMIYVCAVLNSTYGEYHRCLVHHGLSPPRKVDEPARLHRSIRPGQ